MSNPIEDFFKTILGGIGDVGQFLQNIFSGAQFKGGNRSYVKASRSVFGDGQGLVPNAFKVRTPQAPKLDHGAGVVKPPRKTVTVTPQVPGRKSYSFQPDGAC